MGPSVCEASNDVSGVVMGHLAFSVLCELRRHKAVFHNPCSQKELWYKILIKSVMQHEPFILQTDLMRRPWWLHLRAHPIAQALTSPCPALLSPSLLPSSSGLWVEPCWVERDQNSDWRTFRPIRAVPTAAGPIIVKPTGLKHHHYQQSLCLVSPKKSNSTDIFWQRDRERCEMCERNDDKSSTLLIICHIPHTSLSILPSNISNSCCESQSLFFIICQSNLNWGVA